MVAGGGEDLELQLVSSDFSSVLVFYFCVPFIFMILQLLVKLVEMDLYGSLKVILNLTCTFSQ